METILPPRINETGKYLLVIPTPSGGDYIEGKLLSGKDGNLLLGLMMDSGLRAKDFSFASAIDCEEATIEDCRDRLKKTINLTNPEYIIAMGNTTLMSLTKKSGIKKYRGDKLRLHELYESNCCVYPTYSLDDLRAVPTYRRTITADFRNSQQGEAEAVEFTYWRSYDS
jgi:uracil-DNA glycosylase family 4